MSCHLKPDAGSEGEQPSQNIPPQSGKLSSRRCWLTKNP